MRWRGADLMQALVILNGNLPRGQARKTIASIAITINGEKTVRSRVLLEEEDCRLGRFTLLRRGKKNYCPICWK
ncbi:hypothetical protein ACNKHW_10220 [Shigella flexneri]